MGIVKSPLSRVSELVFFSSILPSGTWQLQACPDVFPSLPLSTLSSSPFHCALHDGFGQIRVLGKSVEVEILAYHYCCVHRFTIVRTIVSASNVCCVLTPQSDCESMLQCGGTGHYPVAANQPGNPTATPQEGSCI